MPHASHCEPAVLLHIRPTEVLGRPTRSVRHVGARYVRHTRTHVCLAYTSYMKARLCLAKKSVKDLRTRVCLAYTSDTYTHRSDTLLPSLSLSTPLTPIRTPLTLTPVRVPCMCYRKALVRIAHAHYMVCLLCYVWYVITLCGLHMSIVCYVYYIWYVYSIWYVYYTSHIAKHRGVGISFGVSVPRWRTDMGRLDRQMKDIPRHI